MVIYAELHGTRIRQWSSSFIDEYMEIEIPDSHPMLHSLDNTIYHYLDGKVIEVNDDEYLLEELKKAKIDELSRECQKRIVEGFSIDSEHYSYNQDNQINFQDTYQLFLNNMITEILWNAYIHGEKTRVLLDKDKFQRVYLAGVKHKVDCISRLNDALIPMINSADSKEIVARIYWDEGLDSESLKLDVENTIEKKIEKVTQETNTLQATTNTTMLGMMQLTQLIK